MPRWFTRNDNWDFGGGPTPTEAESGKHKSRRRRLATTFVFTTLFFAGASLAAVAGDRLVTIPDGGSGSALDAAPNSADPSASTDASATSVARPECRAFRRANAITLSCKSRHPRKAAVAKCSRRDAVQLLSTCQRTARASTRARS